jgi:hypothetical protein
MALENPPGAIGFATRVQHDAGDLFPISAVGVRIQEPQLHDQMLAVLRRQRSLGRRRVVDTGIERQQGRVSGEFQPSSPRSGYLQFRDEAPGRRARHRAVGLAGCHGC